MIIHTSDSQQIPSENKTKSKLQMPKKSNFEILQETSHATHLLKFAPEQTQDAGRTDGQTDGRMDGRTDGMKTIYPPTPTPTPTG